MNGTILKAENISKQHRLGTVGTGTLSHDLNRWWHRVRGKEDPYLKVGSANTRSAKATEEYVWALRDINFEVRHGEVLGIIGKNGAGKSTLLKILSRVTSPTTGSIKTKGRIASLLEVGTGFHPELTGRENIHLNGAILGMTKPEIKLKIDEIISFSGCEMYMDTPVKRYSSGMRVRLGFAVAAHLEPEILVVDEVLAVGDAEFQKKAIGKMHDLSSGEGRTVLFVSHNMSSVKSLCTRGIVLENGKSVLEGKVNECIDYYLHQQKEKDISFFYSKFEKDNHIKSVNVTNDSGQNVLVSGEKVIFHIEIDPKTYQNLNIHLGIYDSKGEKITNLTSEYTTPKFLLSRNSQKCIIEKNPFVEGVYYVNILLTSNKERLEHISEVVKFNVLNGDFYGTGNLTEKVPSKFFVEQRWI